MRTVVVLGVLVVAFIGSALWMQHYLIQSGRQLESYVEAITVALTNDDWPTIQQQVDSLLAEWRRTERRWNLCTEHPEIDDLNGALSRLRAYAKKNEAAALLAEAEVARHLFQHIPEKEAFKLANIL